MTRHLRLLPDWWFDGNDQPDIDCLVCMDSGWFVPLNSDMKQPCPDCRRGESNFWTEAYDDMRRGK
jgi:hypothetical protein